jgi:hypothetical protein
MWSGHSCRLLLALILPHYQRGSAPQCSSATQTKPNQPSSLRAPKRWSATNPPSRPRTSCQALPARRNRVPIKSARAKLATPIYVQRSASRLSHRKSIAHCWSQTRLSLLDGDAKKTLRYTAQEADLDHEFWIDADHQLRGLLRFPNAAADALAKLDVGLEAMRAASIRNREEFPSRQVPKEHSRRLLREFLPCS